MEHEWQVNTDRGWSYCKTCGVVRRRDGNNKPCKGQCKMRRIETPIRDMEITPIEEKCIALLKQGDITGTANVGFQLWKDREEQKHYTAQGMALAAGRVLRRLKDKGLVISFTKTNGILTTWRYVGDEI